MTVYPDIMDDFLDPHANDDPAIPGSVTQTLATCAAYAYSDQDVLAERMVEMGFVDSHCLMISRTVDVLLVDSHAVLVQSADGRVVILCYRGISPLKPIDWLTDVDVEPERVVLPNLPGDGDKFVHQGFYGNTRATFDHVVKSLRRAVNGQSVDANRPDPENSLEALYITGHGLGGAMAAMAAVMLTTDPAYHDIAGRLRAVYTFGQPMVGDHAFAKACDRIRFLRDNRLELLRDNFIRYIYDRDVVPHLPPRASGRFAHFGREFRYPVSGNIVANIGQRRFNSWVPGMAVRMVPDRLDIRVLGRGVTIRPQSPFPVVQPNNQDLNGRWTDQLPPAQQVPALWQLIEPLIDFMAGKIKLLRDVPFTYSLDDHFPLHYITALTPEGQRNLFEMVRTGKPPVGASWRAPAAAVTAGPAIVGEQLPVNYTGPLAGRGADITMHWGTTDGGSSNWRNIQSTMMSRRNGSWMAQIPQVPADADLKMTFRNNNGDWDNNNGAEYGLTISNP
ncbi:lipase family protein [Frankia sp. Cppng1_Ct_nod]|uniref:lipase family protein n=1 Tax=Frankia sp. Cppng1_Ct_nod TaxID=2897162 RepID=UPI00104189DC|nr:lipase family protein [Frankia sp. Cppng1_Ct_nod]